MPSQDRVGGHNGRDLPQEPSAESASLRREAAALVIGQAEAASLHLFLQDAVFLHQVLDDMLLVAVDPSSEGHEQHAHGGEVCNHSPILPPDHSPQGVIYMGRILDTAGVTHPARATSSTRKR
jgi:hypothetical protein